MPNANKNKGKAGEREVCKIMSSIFGGSWQRTFTSGAFTGGKMAFRAQMLSESQLLNNSNDIVPPDEYPHAAIEVKTRKEFSFNHFVRPEGVKELNEWIDQVKESGIDMEKSFPMICFKPNRCGWYMLVWFNKVADLDISKFPFVYYLYNGEPFMVIEMESFLINNKENLIKKFM